MTDHTFTHTDNFSWRRVWLFGSLYSREIKWGLIGLSLLMILTYFLSIFLYTHNFLGGVIAVCGLMGYIYYLLPLTFAFAPVDTAAMLPVKPVERWAFILIYTLLIAPLIVQAAWYVPAWIGHIVKGWPTFGPTSSETARLLTDVTLPGSLASFAFISGLVNITAIFTIELLGIFSARRHPILRGIVSVLCYFFIIAVISMIWGLFFGYKTASVLASNPSETELMGILDTWLGPMIIGLVILSVIIIVVGAWMLLRLLRSRQYA